MCSSSDCAGCAYSKVSALFHRGPHRECYRRFFIRHLPWNVLRRAVARTRTGFRKNGVRPCGQRKEVDHKEYTHTLTATSR
jgi:hypothetical protein